MVCLKNLEISCTHKHIFHVVHIYLTFIELKHRKVGNWFTEAITDCRNVCVTHTHHQGKTASSQFYSPKFRWCAYHIHAAFPWLPREKTDFCLLHSWWDFSGITLHSYCKVKRSKVNRFKITCELQLPNKLQCYKNECLNMFTLFLRQRRVTQWHSQSEKSTGSSGGHKKT